MRFIVRIIQYILVFNKKQDKADRQGLPYFFFRSSSLLFSFFVCIPLSFGQFISSVEKTWRYSPQDSILISEKESFRSSSGLIYKKNEFQYSLSGKLEKEYNFELDTVLWKVEENIIKHKNGDTEIEQYRTFYESYDSVSALQKIKYRQYFDINGEMMKEDTLIYKNGNLIQSCTYDYRGNTSKFCRFILYNNKGLIKKDKTYQYYTTVSIKGKAFEKKDLKINQSYFYTSFGQIKKIKAKRNSKNVIELYRYDKSQLKAEEIIKTIKINKNKKNKKTEKEAKKPGKELSTVYRKFKNGLLESEIWEENKTKKKEIIWCRDSLDRTTSYQVMGQKNTEERKKWTYLENSNIRVIQEILDEKGIVKSCIEEDLDKKGFTLEKRWLNGGVLFKKTVYSFDDQGRYSQVSNYFIRPDGKNFLFERTNYQYQ